MVLPALIAGGAAALGLGLSAVLGQREQLFVAWSEKHTLATRPVRSMDEARRVQADLSRKGRGSVVIRKAKGRPFACENFVPGRGAEPERAREVMERRAPVWVVRWKVRRKDGRTAGFGRNFASEAEAEKWRAVLKKNGVESTVEKIEAGRIPEAVPVPRISGRFDDFDTLEEQQRTQDSQEPWPLTPAWAKEARFGPFPARDLHVEGKAYETPDFRETVSSHEWKTDVDTRKLPVKLYPPVFYSQPEKNLVELNPLIDRANV